MDWSCDWCSGHWRTPKTVAPVGQVAGEGAIKRQSATARRKLPWYWLESGTPCGLWRAVGRDQPGLPDQDPRAGDAQAGSFEIRPSPLGAVGANRRNAQ